MYCCPPTQGKLSFRCGRVFDPQGTPVHRRGVTSSPGLFFLGMKNQYSRGSSLIGWVRHDHAFIVEQVRGTRVPT